MEEHPFPDLDIASSEFMDEKEGRENCPKCGKSRRYYCYSCFVPVKTIEKDVPQVKLPIKVDIIKHPNECDGKSTAAHAAILAPADVTVYTFPCIPDYQDKTRVLLVYPSDTSVTFEDYAQSHASHLPPSNDLDHVSTESVHSDNKQADQDASLARETPKQCSQGQKSESKSGENTFSSKRSHNECEEATVVDVKKLRTEETESYPCDRVVFIDSTWNQVKKIAADERLSGLQRIELKSQVTKFWRHQRDKPDTYLATVEAVYYFFREFHEHFVSGEYRGQYDNLLFLFCFMYKKIKHLYDGGKELKAYKKK